MKNTYEICTKCKQPNDNKRSWCKRCIKESTQARQAKRMAEGLCRCGKDLLPNRTCCVACCERSHVWHRKNQDRVNEHKRRYRVENAEKLKIRNAERWANNENNVKEKSALWRANNREKKAAQDAAWYARIRDQVFAYYGDKCACCQVDDPGFLTIDHVHGGGTKHRKQLNRNSIYSWLVKQKFPEGFQTLCFNCNLGRSKCGGVCPHESERQANAAMLQSTQASNPDVVM